MTNQPLRRLQVEHLKLKSLLRIIERQLDSVKSGNKPDYGLMHEIIHYLTFYPDRYHHPFEELVLSRLAMDPAVPLVEMYIVQEQHRQIAQSGQKLRNMVGNIIDGALLHRSGLLRLGRDYVRNYKAHLRFEEKVIFPKVREILTPADWLVLTTTFHWKMQPEITEEVETEYRNICDAITAEGAGSWPWHTVRTETCPVCSAA